MSLSDIIHNDNTFLKTKLDSLPHEELIIGKPTLAEHISKLEPLHAESNVPQPPNVLVPLPPSLPSNVPPPPKVSVPPKYKRFEPAFKIKKSVIESAASKEKVEYVPKVSEIILEQFIDKYNESGAKPRNFQLLDISKKQVANLLDDYEKNTEINNEMVAYINKKTKDQIQMPTNLLDEVYAIFDKPHHDAYIDLIARYVNVLVALYTNMSRQYEYDEKEGKVKEASRMKQLLDLLKDFMTKGNYREPISTYAQIPTKSSLKQQRGRDLLHLCIQKLYDGVINKPDLTKFIDAISELQKGQMAEPIDDISQFHLERITEYKTRTEQNVAINESLLAAFEAVYNNTATEEQSMQIYDYFAQGPKPLLELLTMLPANVDKQLKSTTVSISFSPIIRLITGGKYFYTVMIIVLSFIIIMYIVWKNWSINVLPPIYTSDIIVS